MTPATVTRPVTCFRVERLALVERGTFEAREWRLAGEHRSRARARVALVEWLHETDAPAGVYRCHGGRETVQVAHEGTVAA